MIHGAWTGGLGKQRFCAVLCDLTSSILQASVFPLSMVFGKMHKWVVSAYQGDIVDGADSFCKCFRRCMSIQQALCICYCYTSYRIRKEARALWAKAEFA